MCHTNNWAVNETVFQLPEHKPNVGFVIGGVVFPVIPIMCSNCGNTVFINAIKAGLLPPMGAK